ncbi:MAG: hypothetical protein IPJ66_10300 [Bacteroidetes bacterium]|nr:hypothetical protein [Bacteroidota bacterium]
MDATLGHAVNADGNSSLFALRGLGLSTTMGAVYMHKEIQAHSIATKHLISLKNTITGSDFLSGYWHDRLFPTIANPDCADKQQQNLERDRFDILFNHVRI